MSVSHKALNRLLARGDLADLRAKLQLLETAARDEWVLAQDKDGTTQLHKACEKGHVEVAEYLIDNGVDVNARKRDGKTPLHEACNHGHVRCAALLLERGADANAHKTNGWTAMHYAAIEDSEQLIQLLYSHGALLDEKNEDGCTALFLAAREGSASALRALINLGANPIVPMTSTRVTPIMAAAAAGKLNTFQVLLETVAHAGREEGDAVMWQVIAEGGNVEMLEQWIDQRSRSIPKAGMNNGFHRLPPLHIACTRGNVDVVRALLERQLVDPNERDVDGCTALYHAASMGAADVVQVLLTHGAEPNSGSSRRTPLHCAVGWGHIKCAELLLRHGADRSITDDEQRTPLQLLQDMPIKRGHVEELQALLMNDNISAR